MRGLLAPLSSNEEVTLRRVAVGSTSTHKLAAEHLKRLEQLKLIEAAMGGYRLTPLGRQRYNALPRAAGLATDGSPGAIEQILSNVIRSRQT
jgi:predicted transcriptional regulator